MSRIEVINRNTLSSLFIRGGFNVFLPVFDEGIDLIAHREADNCLHRVQLKARFTLAMKYVGRGLHIAFPVGETWFLVPHDDALGWPETQTLQATASWLNSGVYHWPRLPAALRSRCERHRFPEVLEGRAL